MILLDKTLSTTVIKILTFLTNVFWNILYKKACVRYSWRESLQNIFGSLEIVWKIELRNFTLEMRRYSFRKAECPRDLTGQDTEGRKGDHHPEIPPFVTRQQSASVPPPTSLRLSWASPYLLVGSWVGLPEALHFADRCLCSQTGQEGARRLLWKPALTPSMAASRASLFAQAQGPWLQFIMQLHRIELSSRFFLRTMRNSKAPTSTKLLGQEHKNHP